MKPVKSIRLIIFSILILSFTACSNNALLGRGGSTPTLETAVLPTEVDVTSTVTEIGTPEASISQPVIEEVEVVPLKIPERIQAASFEYSGLGWFGDYLVLLPQYPEGKDFTREAALFAIAKKDLLLAVEDPTIELPVRDVPIFNSDLRDEIKGFEGFESILFVDQTVYLTIESRAGNPMMGYLIIGEVLGELESITLDPESLVELVPLSSARNITFEAMTFWNGNLYVIYEHNSMQNATQPVAYEFNQDLEFEREITFPVINFRVTDATSSDSSGKFWIMNYYFPGDTFLAVDEDPLVLEYGEGETHAKNEPVERLVELQIEDSAISLVDQPPIYLQLLEDNVARNWEGIALLEEMGFLLITDSFPDSLLGFCPRLR